MFIALETLKEFLGDMLPMSALIEEHRLNQYLADVAQENAERQAKKCGNFGSEHASDPRKAECWTGEQPRKAFSMQ